MSDTKYGNKFWYGFQYTLTVIRTCLFSCDYSWSKCE